jgi:glycine/D-amino acid oxidase-like deaminating enzyme
MRPLIILSSLGVIGLTTAVLLQDKGGYNVTIVAECYPGEPKSIKYTSRFAGAHHCYNDTDDPLQRELEHKTFKKLWEMSEPECPTADLFARLPQIDHFIEPRSATDQLRTMPDYEVLHQDKLWPGAVEGATYTTVNIDTPRYLIYLLSRFRSNGGTIFRSPVQSIEELARGETQVYPLHGESGKLVGIPVPQTIKVDAVIACIGISARYFGGVNDKNIVSIRGQTVTLRAPWVKAGKSVAGETGAFIYIIPRPSGDIIVGGTREVDDWHPMPRAPTTRKILEDGLALCPELAPPEVTAVRKPTLNDVLPLVVDESCGLRPARNGGIRLEVQWILRESTGESVPVVFNYGHGGYGYQTSWGSAEKAVELLEAALANPKSA